MSLRVDAGGKLVRITDEELREGLRQFAATVHGRAFTQREFMTWRARPFGAHCAAGRFGSWRNALKEIGIMHARGRNYQPAELVDEVERVWKELGRPPGEIELPRRGKFSLNAYKRRWGSLRKLCEMISRHHRGEITRDQLLAVLPGAGARTSLPIDTRWKIIKRDNYRCTACGSSPATDHTVELHVDHIIPVSRGGSNEEKNLRTLCRDCNVGRGAEHAERE